MVLFQPRDLSGQILLAEFCHLTAGENQDISRVDTAALGTLILSFDYG